MSTERDVPDLGMSASQLMRALQDELFRRLAEQGHPDVRPRHGTVLAFLDPAGARAPELAARSGQHKITLQNAPPRRMTHGSCM